MAVISPRINAVKIGKDELSKSEVRNSIAGL
jgi:hypothetical protein